MCRRWRAVEILSLSMAPRSGRSLFHEIWIWLELKVLDAMAVRARPMFASGFPGGALQFECILLILQSLQKPLHEFLLLRQLSLKALDLRLR